MVNSVVNRVLKERPSDPLGAIAKSLLLQSSRSFPTFDRLNARKASVGNQLGKQTLKIDVFLTFKGRPGMRYQHVFAFDTEEADKMLLDADGSMRTALGVINKEIN